MASWLAVAVLALLQTPDALDHTSWRFSGVKGGYTVTFDGGRYLLRACNNVSGPYKTDGSRLILQPGISTRKACQPDAEALSRDLLQALSSNDSFRVNGDNLTLVSKNKSLTLTSEYLPSKSAITKFVYVASTRKACTGVAPMQCLQIRDNPGEPWRLHYGEIIGFEHVPGIEYRLRILEDKRANVPADASRLIWSLDMVVEQKVVDRAAADAFQAKKDNK